MLAYLSYMNDGIGKVNENTVTTIDKQRTIFQVDE